MNKKTILIGLLCIFIFSSSFAQTVSFTQSAMNTATFGNYSLEYDCYFNEIYFPFANNNKISTYTGVNNDQLNIGVSGQLSKNWYGAFWYGDIISDYKWWPQNMNLR